MIVHLRPSNKHRNKYYKIHHLSGGQQVVHVLKKSLVLDFIVSENKRDSLALMASRPVQHLQVIEKVGSIIGPNVK